MSIKYSTHKSKLLHAHTHVRLLTQSTMSTFSTDDFSLSSLAAIAILLK